MSKLLMGLRSGEGACPLPRKKFKTITSWIALSRVRVHWLAEHSV